MNVTLERHDSISHASQTALSYTILLVLASQRASETPNERHTRLLVDAISHALQRASETLDERQFRMEENTSRRVLHEAKPIDFPLNFAIMVASSVEVIARLFPSVADSSGEWLCKRAIVAHKNNPINIMNSEILTAIPGEKHNICLLILSWDKMEQFNIQYSF